MNLRESQIMKIHYLTGVCALFVVAVHIIMRLIVPFSTSLTYENVIGNYHNIPYAVLLEIILILIAIHASEEKSRSVGNNTRKIWIIIGQHE